MTAKKKKKHKPHGHYCYVCGEHKANEKFSGRGHANHICKKCHALPVAARNEMIAERKRDRMDYRDYNREAPKLAELKTPVLFSELKDEYKSEAIERLAELIDDFFLGADYLPDDEDKAEILAELCEEMSDTINQWEPEPYNPAADFDPRFDFGPELSFDEKIAKIQEILDADAEDFDPYAEPEEPEPELQKELIADAALESAFDTIIAEIVAELKVDGIELPTFMETLTVVETDRLIIRRLYKTDLAALWAFMKKPEVMYAWEHGFKRSAARKWLNRQYTRYHKDGFGYFAVTLKDSGRLIGQAGLMKSEVEGEAVTEIGYIFDNSVWGQGYAVEAARACVDLAFNRFGLDKLYATIRPENTTSVRLAEKLGMRKVGRYTKIYEGKEMSHDIYILMGEN
ncbi:GNAT family N-acetyltransferase [Ruminococcaceae bacterium OttesenSCG-928-L11]|nr:GNAT family N-acetyltransferase [Ruminococcaceae bacterium OttesenSCG-928-L11]